MALCKACEKKNVPSPSPQVIRCEICYQDKESEFPGALICKECAEPCDLCEVCKDSIEVF